jgi:DNA-binding MarR family transcriptional regulator
MDSPRRWLGAMGAAVAGAADAAAFEELFGAVYLAFHRRDGKRSGLTAASRATLTHLAMAGPLTVGEAARHLDRAQSVVSDIVTGLEARGLLAREADPDDRRRTLVWLTPDGFAELERDRQVLAADLVSRAMADLPAEHRRALLDGMRALVAAARPPSVPPTPA